MRDANSLPSDWSAPVSRGLIELLRRSLPWIGVGALVAVMVIAVADLLTRRSHALNHRTRTLIPLGLTVLLAVVWPYILAFPSALLFKLRPPQPFTLALINGMKATAIIMLVLNLFYYICRKNGLAQVHFRWPEPVRRILMRNFSWYFPIVAGCTFFVSAMESVPEMEYWDTLTKCTLIIQFAAGIVAGDEVIGFFADRTGGPATELFDAFLRIFA